MKLLTKNETKIVLAALEEWIDVGEYAMEDLDEWTLEEIQNHENAKKLYARLK